MEKMALVLTDYVERGILVVEASKTPKDIISYELSLLKKDKILGVVLNNISGISPYYSYRYNYAYGYIEYSK